MSKQPETVEIEDTPYSPSAKEIVESMAPAATIESVLLSIAAKLDVIESKLDAVLAKPEAKKTPEK
jgi:hypothetical protein